MGNAVGNRRGDLVLIFEIDVEGAVGDLCRAGNFIDRRGLKPIRAKTLTAASIKRALVRALLPRLRASRVKRSRLVKNRTPI
jgi:hypothetical protein